MPVTQITKGKLIGGKQVVIQPLNFDGTLPLSPKEAIVVTDISDISVDVQIEQGDKVVDKADGVGVIGVHEEDDTLVGVDMELSLGSLNIPLINAVLGGNMDVSNNVASGITLPSISDQRSLPLRFQVDIYVPSYTGTTLDGYLVHRYFYCKGMYKGNNLTVGDIASPVVILKARPHPSSSQVEYIFFTPSLP